MRLLLLLLLFPIIIQATTHLHLSVGSTKTQALRRAAQYNLIFGRSFPGGLGFELGASFMQSSLKGEDFTTIAFPYAGIKQTFHLKRLPFKLFLGAGYGLNHTPSNFGTAYVSTHLSTGLVYLLNKHQFIVTEYRANYGKILSGGHSFDGHTISLGIGFHLKHKQKKYALPPELLKQQQPPRQKQNRRRRSNQPSTYQQTQKLMNDLSWPTY